MQVGIKKLDKLQWHVFTGTPDLLGLKPTTTTASIVFIEREETIIECKEATESGEGQLYAAMMLLSASIVLSHVMKGKNVPEETIETVTTTRRDTANIRKELATTSGVAELIRVLG